MTGKPKKYGEIKLSNKNVEFILKTLKNKPCLSNLKETSPEYFLLNYIQFETLTRLLLKYADSNLKPSSPIRMDSVTKAFNTFNLSISDQKLDILLNSKLNKVGSRSAKNLRNALVHAWSESARHEVESRSSILNKAIFEVINSIKELVNLSSESKKTEA
ncbi:hypothetical protein [Idiomarina sp.]|uniref:hypothetical protein n=1 Tax=Idiomarina sp. TaxID=1874361 RepID=UPI002584DDC3|nr:hypothetical protein [Idiomarina sp.]